MITQRYRNGNSVAKIKIIGKDILFTNVHYGFRRYINISKILKNVRGIVKEFPDLEGKPDEYILEEGEKRFKKKLKDLGSELKIARYVQREMLKYYGMQLEEESNK